VIRAASWGLLDVLQFIDEEGESRASVLCGLPGNLQERLQVVFEIAVVRKPRFRFEIEADFNVAVLELERFGKPSQTPKARSAVAFACDCRESRNRASRS
jgi:hypothetical protein